MYTNQSLVKIWVFGTWKESGVNTHMKMFHSHYLVSKWVVQFVLKALLTVDELDDWTNNPWKTNKKTQQHKWWKRYKKEKKGVIV
jgi:thiol:disulfide interchange protein